MRSKVVLGILLLATVVLVTAVFLSRSVHHESDGGIPGNVPAAQISTSASPAKVVAPPAPPVGAVIKPVVIPAPAGQETNHAAYVVDRNAELMALAMNDDTNSLNIIWSELANPDKEIRAGALAAVVQFGDHSVVPRLRELAAQTDDAAEKASILEAADFLELPSLTEERNAPATNEPPAH